MSEHSKHARYRDDSPSSVFEKLLGDSLLKTWIKAHLDYPHHNWCLIWPFSKGDGTVQLGVSPSINVYRLICEYRNGPPPTEKHQASHSCGRRHEHCVNPLHRSWKTNSENQIERYQHSGPAKRAKLTPEQVDEIKSLEGRAKIRDIAHQFNVSSNNIRAILAGKLWKDTSSRMRRVFSEDEVHLIRTSEKPIQRLSEEFGVERGTIYRIRNKITYKWVGDEQ